MRENTRTKGDSRRRRGLWVLLAAALLALGMALGPMVADGITTAISTVRLSGPVVLPVKTPVNVSKNVQITSGSPNPWVGQVAYTVPLGKWLVVKSVSAHAWGPGQLATLFVQNTGGNVTSVNQIIPFTVVPAVSGGSYRGSNTLYSGFEDMEWYIKGGSTVWVVAAAHNKPNAGSSYSADFALSGYLVTAP